MHHKDSNKNNNKRENLELHCPNCHSQTKNYKNKKNSTCSSREEQSALNR